MGYPAAVPHAVPTTQSAPQRAKLGATDFRVWESGPDGENTRALMALGLPEGIARTLQRDRRIVAHFGVFDNSTSMDWGEGQVPLVGSWGGAWEKCKAYQEQAAEFGLAVEIRARLDPPSWTVPLDALLEEKPSARRNGTQFFDNKSEADRAIIRSALDAPPAGITPLAERVRDIHAFVKRETRAG